MGKTILDMLAADPNVSPALKAILTRQALRTESRDDEQADLRQEDRQDAAARRDEREEAGL